MYMDKTGDHKTDQRSKSVSANLHAVLLDQHTIQINYLHLKDLQYKNRSGVYFTLHIGMAQHLAQGCWWFHFKPLGVVSAEASALPLTSIDRGSSWAAWEPVKI